MINHIVVAVDASPSSDNAVDLGINMAKTYGAKLSFLNVIRDMQLPESVMRMAEVEHIHGPRSDVLRFVGEKTLNWRTKKPRMPACWMREKRSPSAIRRRKLPSSPRGMASI